MGCYEEVESVAILIGGDFSASVEWIVVGIVAENRVLPTIDGVQLVDLSLVDLCRGCYASFDVLNSEPALPKKAMDLAREVEGALATKALIFSSCLRFFRRDDIDDQGLPGT